MNGIEALKALEEGKIVETMHGRLYRMIGDEVQYYNEEKKGWEPFEIGLNVWINRYYELSPKPFFNLTFFEAMCEAAQGKVVSNMEQSSFKYCMKDGVLYAVGGVLVDLQPWELDAKWRVVEEEEE